MDEVERRRDRWVHSETVFRNGHVPTALDAVVGFLSDLTNEGRPNSEIAAMTPETADALVIESGLIADAVEHNPWLSGAFPEVPAFQCWTASSGHLTNTRSPSSPSPARMLPIEGLAPNELTRRPLPGGLFTASSVPGQLDMWRRFMMLNSNPDSEASLWRRPWITWALEPHSDVRIQSIESATQWVGILEYAGLRGAEDGLTYLNWATLATEWDAIRLTLPAVSAIDGASFFLSSGVSAPHYFSCECTLWFRWVFAQAEVIEAS